MWWGGGMTCPVGALRWQHLWAWLVLLISCAGSACRIQDQVARTAAAASSLRLVRRLGSPWRTTHGACRLLVPLRGGGSPDTMRRAPVPVAGGAGWRAGDIFQRITPDSGEASEGPEEDWSLQSQESAGPPVPEQATAREHASGHAAEFQKIPTPTWREVCERFPDELEDLVSSSSQAGGTASSSSEQGTFSDETHARLSAAAVVSVPRLEQVAQSFETMAASGAHGRNTNSTSAQALDPIFTRMVNKLKPTTPLMSAAAAGNEACVQWLLSHGARADVRGPVRITALHLAAGNGHEQVCRVLLRVAPQILEWADEFGGRAVHYAADKGMLPVLEFLYAEGADMVARGPANVTCLKLAAERNHGPAVAFLESVVGGKSAQKHAPCTGMVGRIDWGLSSEKGAEGLVGGEDSGGGDQVDTSARDEDLDYYEYLANDLSGSCESGMSEDRAMAILNGCSERGVGMEAQATQEVDSVRLADRIVSKDAGMDSPDEKLDDALASPSSMHDGRHPKTGFENEAFSINHGCAEGKEGLNYLDRAIARRRNRKGSGSQAPAVSERDVILEEFDKQVAQAVRGGPLDIEAWLAESSDAPDVAE